MAVEGTGGLISEPPGAFPRLSPDSRAPAYAPGVDTPASDIVLKPTTLSMIPAAAARSSPGGRLEIFSSGRDNSCFFSSSPRSGLACRPAEASAAGASGAAEREGAAGTSEIPRALIPKDGVPRARGPPAIFLTGKSSFSSRGAIRPVACEEGEEKVRFTTSPIAA